MSSSLSVCCFDCKSTKNLRAIHNWFLLRWWWRRVVSTAKVQKIWEQFTTLNIFITFATWLFRLQKYKKFESNSQHYSRDISISPVVSTAKVQKIWEQFTTYLTDLFHLDQLFRLQKYKKFESNSQLRGLLRFIPFGCFDCKSTKNLRAIHNKKLVKCLERVVVSTAKVQKIWEQFTTVIQPTLPTQRCFDCKSTKNLRAIHNVVFSET